MQPVSFKRDAKLRKVSPFNGYKFKERPASVSKNRSIYIPERDHPSYHLILQNMRNSYHYVKDKKHFEKPFMKHLEKTGFDETGVICRKEWQTNKSNQKRKFGQGDDGFIDYPWVADKYWKSRKRSMSKKNDKKKQDMFKEVVNMERKKSMGNIESNDKDEQGEVVQKESPVKRRLASAPFQRVRRRAVGRSSGDKRGGYNVTFNSNIDDSNDECVQDEELPPRPMTAVKRKYRGNQRTRFSSKSMETSLVVDNRRLQSAGPRARFQKRYRHYIKGARIKRPRLREKKYRKNDRFSRTPYKHSTGDWMEQTTFDPVRRKITPKITKSRVPSASNKSERNKSASKSKKYCKLLRFNSYP